jgi:hypothetical protein
VKGAFTAAKIPGVRDFFLCNEPEACALYTVQEALNRETTRDASNRGPSLPDEVRRICTLVFNLEFNRPLTLTRGIASQSATQGVAQWQVIRCDEDGLRC